MTFHPKRSQRPARGRKLKRRPCAACPVHDRPASVSRATTASKIPVEPVIPGRWLSCAEAVVGTSHRRQTPPQPCQDAVWAEHDALPMLWLADGAGSAALSHLGATATVRQSRRLVLTLAESLRPWLDRPESPDPEAVRIFALRLIKHVIGCQEDLAREHWHTPDDYRSTLLGVVVGHRRLFWVKVGDGEIVLEQGREWRRLGTSGKGEHANETRFIGPRLGPEEVQYGVEPLDDLHAVCLMSDGAAEKLVAHDGSRVSAQLGRFAEDLRQETWSRVDLHRFLTHPDVWRTSSGDDKSLALLVRQPPTRAISG